MTEPTIPGMSQPATGRQLHQLVHDLRTPLSVISMGIEILKQVRQDPEQFSRVTTMIAEEGIEPIKRLLAEVADHASGNPATPRPDPKQN